MLTIACGKRRTHGRSTNLPRSHHWEVLIFHMRSGHVEQFAEMKKPDRVASLKSGQNLPGPRCQGLAGVTDIYLVLVPMTVLPRGRPGPGAPEGFRRGTARRTMTLKE